MQWDAKVSCSYSHIWPHTVYKYSHENIITSISFHILNFLWTSNSWQSSSKLSFYFVLFVTYWEVATYWADFYGHCFLEIPSSVKQFLLSIYIFFTLEVTLSESPDMIHDYCFLLSPPVITAAVYNTVVATTHLNMMIICLVLTKTNVIKSIYKTFI